MSAFSRLMRGGPVTSCRRPDSSVVLGVLRNAVGSTRRFAQAARQEVDEEEVEIDPRRLPADYDPATFNPTGHRSPPTERVWRLVDEVTGLTLVEVAALSKIMMMKLGMIEPGAIGGVGGGSANAPAAGKGEKKAAAEKTAFELKLESFEAASKLKVIKEIRAITELGLKEAKDLVEKTPSVFKRGVTKEEGEKIMEKLKAIGAKVVME